MHLKDEETKRKLNRQLLQPVVQAADFEVFH